MWYGLAYLKDPAKRGPGLALGMLGWIALLVMAGVGLVHAAMTVG